MKLKDGMILHEVAGDHMAVATGQAAESFVGMIRNNETADYIFTLLMEPITEEEIINAVCRRYHADHRQVETDVRVLLEQLRQVGLLEEDL